MINTRISIFKTLQKRIRELTKHAQVAPKEFKKIILAVIINDLKEWSEYIPKDNPNEINNRLEEFIMENCFIIDRTTADEKSYRNVNTPQTNTTWQRIWDQTSSDTYNVDQLEEKRIPWTPDPNCDVKMVYFDKGVYDTDLEYLTNTYGQYGSKLKTICDKMNIFINRETGKAWYLDTNCDWAPVGSKDSEGVTPRDVRNIIESYKINHEQNSVNGNIYAKLNESEESPIEFCTNQEMEDLV